MIQELSLIIQDTEATIIIIPIKMFNTWEDMEKCESDVWNCFPSLINNQPCPKV